MTNMYRALSASAKSEHGEKPVELDLSVMDEKDALDGGHLELVPREYKVLSDNFSGGPQDSTYQATFRREIEAALIQGGHIQRIDAPAPEAAPVEEPLAEEPPADAPAKKASK